MAIEDLTNIVAPPSDPVDAGPESRLSAVEEKLGLTLPQDIIDFGLTYGTGSFASNQFMVLNPFAPWYVGNVQEVCGLYHGLQRDEGDKFIPYAVHPDRPGLFPWGAEDNGHQMFWLTEGNADKWPILLFNRDSSEFERWDMPVTTFLGKVFRLELACVLWSDETQRMLRREFESY